MGLPVAADDGGVLDLAVVGGGVGGARVAWGAAVARPAWRIGLFEASQRIGGRLLSLRVDGIPRVRAELGGMRFRSSQPLVSGVVDALGLETRAFHTVLDDNRYLLRGDAWTAGEPRRAASVYALPPDLAGLTPAEVLVEALQRVVPGALELTDADWADARRSFVFGGRLLREWSFGDALAAVVDQEALAYLVDEFGYRTVLADRNAADAIPWILIEARPEAENRTLVDGMERLPRALAEAFGALGGSIAYGHELAALGRVDADPDGPMRLAFNGQPDVLARRVVLAMPPAALGRLGGELAPRRAGDALIGSVTATPASKLFQVYERAWWRADGFAGMRTVSDLPLSKTYYFDFERTGTAADGPAMLLASYADGRNRDAWVDLAQPATAEDDAPYDAIERWAAHPASAALLAAAAEQLSATHSGINVPAPTLAAFIDWSEGAWHTWNAGVRSDEVMERVVQLRSGVPVWVCSEAFSASQGWVEGALESAERALHRLLA